MNSRGVARNMALRIARASGLSEGHAAGSRQAQTAAGNPTAIPCGDAKAKIARNNILVRALLDGMPAMVPLVVVEGKHCVGLVVRNRRSTNRVIVTILCRFEGIFPQRRMRRLGRSGNRCGLQSFKIF
ncbi:MAG: hypothetical protein KGQ60_20045, partial [Planctomycetes bacterium]|nr:hypothetical protein [Planctomycetota bacterium]